MKDLRYEFVSGKVSEWANDVVELAGFAKKEPLAAH